MAKATAKATARVAIYIHPTHRDVAAMDGAPGCYRLAVIGRITGLLFMLRVFDLGD
jgi:hypothetical protein